MSTIVTRKRNAAMPYGEPDPKKRKLTDEHSSLQVPPEILTLIANKVDRASAISLRNVNKLFRDIFTYVHGQERSSDIWILVAKFAQSSIVMQSVSYGQLCYYDRIWLEHPSASSRVISNMDCGLIAVIAAAKEGNITFATWAITKLRAPIDTMLPIVFAVYSQKTEFVNFWMGLTEKNTVQATTNIQVLRQAVVRFNQWEMIPLMQFENMGPHQFIYWVETCLSNCSSNFVHKMLYHVSGRIQSIKLENRIKLWKRSFKLPLEVFKTMDRIAFLPSLNNEPEMRRLLASGNYDVFCFLKSRIVFQDSWNNTTMIECAIEGNEPRILEWLVKERLVTANSEMKLIKVVSYALSHKKQHSMLWILNNMATFTSPYSITQLAATQQTFDTIINSLLCVKECYSYSEVEHVFKALFGKSLEQIMDLNLSVSSTTYCLAACQPETLLLDLFVRKQKIALDDPALMAHAILHQRTNVVSWLKRNKCLVDWRSMGATVVTGSYEQVREHHEQLQSAKSTPGGLYSWRVTALAARRGDVDILSYLGSQGYPIISAVFMEAIKSRSMQCVKWIASQSPECIELTSRFVQECIKTVRSHNPGSFSTWFISWMGSFVNSKSHQVKHQEMMKIRNKIDQNLALSNVADIPAPLRYSNCLVSQINEPLQHILPIEFSNAHSLIECNRWYYSVQDTQSHLIVEKWLEPIT